jgi:hypothetical protein
MNIFKRIFCKEKPRPSKPKSDNLLCPNCGGDLWHEGPGGGSFGNIQCGKCKKWYNNLGPFGLKEISK